MVVPVDKNHVPSPLLTETELLRRLNLGHYDAGKLREAGGLVPDHLTQNGRLRLYRPGRVKELAAAMKTATGSTAS